jgi:DNA repair exonuclease SbcCD nuclease subunit
MDLIRVLLLADTHLGYDHVFKPRIKRRRRGTDFFLNYVRALGPALEGNVDLVVHGGDILYRSKVPARLVDMAFAPLRRIAAKGTPVYVVPGNHERSRISFEILAGHPNIHIFDRPRCFTAEIRGFRLVLAGFPFLRENIRKEFPRLLEATGWEGVPGDGYLLCIHQSVDGAQAGPRNFTFRGQNDVIDVRDIPSGFAAVLAGHMHRFQVLGEDTQGAHAATPVFYPGSIERTSFAERNETKGYLTLDISVERSQKGRLYQWTFHELPTRPMVRVEYDTEDRENPEFEPWLRERVKKVPDDAILCIRIKGEPDADLLRSIRAKSLRSLLPEANVSVRFADGRRRS